MGAKGVDVFIFVLVFVYCGFIFTVFQVASVSSTEDHNYGVRVMKVDVVKRNTSEELRLDSDAAGRKLLGLIGELGSIGELGKAFAQSRNEYKEFKSGDQAAEALTNIEDNNYFLKLSKKKCTDPNYAACCVTMAGTVACSRYCCFDKYAKKICKIFEFTNGDDKDTGDDNDLTCPTSLTVADFRPTGPDPTSSTGANSGSTGLDPTSSNGANSGSTGVPNGSGLKNIASVYVLSSISLCYFIYILLLS